MRLPYITIALILALPAFASLSLQEPEGKFSRPHPIGLLGYANAAACQKDGGKWDAGTCDFAASDDIYVSKTATGFTVQVDTVGTNAHTCNFAGTAIFTSENVLLSSAEGEDSHLNPAPCGLRITFTDADAVNVEVTKPEGCASFCGANATLAIRGAKRVNSPAAL